MAEADGAAAAAVEVAEVGKGLLAFNLIKEVGEGTTGRAGERAEEEAELEAVGLPRAGRE